MDPFSLKVVRQIRGTAQPSPDDRFCVVTESPLTSSTGYSFLSTKEMTEAETVAVLGSIGTSGRDAERLIRQARAEYRKLLK